MLPYHLHHKLSCNCFKSHPFILMSEKSWKNILIHLAMLHGCFSAVYIMFNTPFLIPKRMPMSAWITWPTSNFGETLSPWWTWAWRTSTPPLGASCWHPTGPWWKAKCYCERCRPSNCHTNWPRITGTSFSSWMFDGSELWLLKKLSIT